MVHERVRFRFSKQGDLRLVSHRDLARTCERLFRRAEVVVCQSEGFHPKPRMMFPSALALGVAGSDEVLEVDLEGAIPLDELLARLAAHSPPGLMFHSAEVVPPGTKKIQGKSQTFQVPIPEDRQAEVCERARAILAAPSYPVEREEVAKTVDLRPFIEELCVDEGVLRFKLRIAHERAARPRDILVALGLADLESHGLFLTRTAVELHT